MALADSNDEQVDPEFFRLRKLLTRRGYGDIFSAIDGLDGTYVTEARKKDLFRRVDDRLILVEARVENHGDSGLSMEGRDQVVVQRILFTRHGLQTAGVVDVIHRRQTLAPLGPDPVLGIQEDEHRGTPGRV